MASVELRGLAIRVIGPCTSRHCVRPAARYVRLLAPKAGEGGVCQYCLELTRLGLALVGGIDFTDEALAG